MDTKRLADKLLEAEGAPSNHPSAPVPLNEGREADVEAMLLEVLGECDTAGIARVSSFEESGVMTGNRGIILRMEDGKEFQLTIVQSR